MNAINFGSKNFLLFFISGIFLLLCVNFISSLCSSVGSVSEGMYCDVDGELKPLKQGSSTCNNDFECLTFSCTEGLCQSLLPSFDERTNFLKDIWVLFSNEECDPIFDLEYHCEDNVAFLCGADRVWEEKGKINGVCGFLDSPMYSGGGGSSRIEIVIDSPRNVTYSSNIISLNVYDKLHRANYWKYTLNGGSRQDFIPNTTINAREGANHIDVFASMSKSFSVSYAKGVSFSVKTLGVASNICGDGLCSSSEDCSTCFGDCGSCQAEEPSTFCGNSICDIDESSSICLDDCEIVERVSYIWLFWVIVGVLSSGIVTVGFFVFKRIKVYLM